MNKTYALDGVQSILTYPFKQPGWQSKFAIGVVLFFANSFVPLLPGILVTGYYAKIMHSIIVDDAEPSLPEWDNWSDLFSRGFKVTCATLIYIAPALLLIIGGYLLAYIPLAMEIISSSSRYYGSSDMSPVSMLGMMAGLGMLFLGLVLYFPLILILPPALTHAIAKNSFVAAFRVGEWFAILRANFLGFFTAIAITSGVYMLLFSLIYIFYFITIFCYFIPLIIMSFLVIYLAAIGAPLLGEAYRKGVDKLAETVAA